MNTRPRFVVVGGGGHAKVVISTIEAADGEVVSVIDDDPAVWGRSVLGHVVTGPIRGEAIPKAAAVILAIGSNRARAALAARLPVKFGTVVHPSAVVHPSVTIGEGTVVFAGAVVQADTVLGPHSIINSSASVDHDGRLGACVHIAPGARLAGQVTIGEGALIGVGAALVPQITVGNWATVGAGATVIHNVAQGTTVVGCPARPLPEE
jgi:sugar O-acyltransferase (sialic acid O-acetyltransferase NeuD family)